MFTLGEKILRERKKLKLTQTQLGVMIGIPKEAAKNRISNYEKGKRFPNEDTIEALAKALNVSTDYLTSPTDATVSELMELFVHWSITYGVFIDMDPETNHMMLKFPTPENSNPALLLDFAKDTPSYLSDGLFIERAIKDLSYYKKLHSELERWYDVYWDTPKKDDKN